MDRLESRGMPGDSEWRLQSGKSARTPLRQVQQSAVVNPFSPAPAAMCPSLDEIFSTPEKSSSEANDASPQWRSIGPDGNISMRWSIDEMAQLMPVDISPGAVARQIEGSQLTRSANRAIARAAHVASPATTSLKPPPFRPRGIPSASSPTATPEKPRGSRVIHDTPSWAVTESPKFTSSPSTSRGAETSPSTSTYRMPHSFLDGFLNPAVAASCVPPTKTSTAMVDASTQSELSFHPDDILAIESVSIAKKAPLLDPPSVSPLVSPIGAGAISSSTPWRTALGDSSAILPSPRSDVSGSVFQHSPDMRFGTLRLQSTPALSGLSSMSGPATGSSRPFHGRLSIRSEQERRSGVASSPAARNRDSPGVQTLEHRLNQLRLRTATAHGNRPATVPRAAADLPRHSLGSGLGSAPRSTGPSRGAFCYRDQMTGGPLSMNGIQEVMKEWRRDMTSRTAPR